MWTNSLHGALDIVVRTIIYSMLLIGIRLTGKREVGQLTPFDFVLLLVVSNAVQKANATTFAKQTVRRLDFKRRIGGLKPQGC